MKNLFLFTVICLSTTIHAKEVKLGVGLSLPPYIIENQNSGMEYEIVDKALEVKGHKFVPVYLPFARVPVALESGQTEGALTINEGTGIKVCYSEPHIVYQNFAISLKKNNFAISNISDLAKHSITAFQNAKIYLGDDFAKMSQTNKNYVEDAQQIAQNKKLYMGRVDVVVGDKNIFNYYNQELKDVDTKQEVVFHEIFPKTPYKVGFKDEKICKDFNEGLKAIKENGTYDAIVKKYVK